MSERRQFSVENVTFGTSECVRAVCVVYTSIYQPAEDEELWVVQRVNSVESVTSNR